MTTTIHAVCPKCGAIHNSGKISCCGRGGFWFRNCGAAGNTKLEHTWQEGIRACKARTQSKTTMRQRLNAAQRKGNAPSNDIGMEVKSVTIAHNTFASPPQVNSHVRHNANHCARRRFNDHVDRYVNVQSSHTVSEHFNTNASITESGNLSITKPARTPMANPPTNMLMTTPSHTPASTSVTAQGCGRLSDITAQISLLLIIVLGC